MFVLPSSPYGLGAVRIPLPQGLRGGSSAGPQPRALPPLHRSPQHPACPPACCWPLPLCPASPPRAQEGLAELSSRPGDLAWTQACPPRECCTCIVPQLKGCPLWFAGFLEHSPLSMCAGRSNSVGKRCWDITMETASLYRAASVCMAKGCPHPLSASVVLTWQSSASGTKEWFILQRFFPRGHLNIGV